MLRSASSVSASAHRESTVNSLYDLVDRWTLVHFAFWFVIGAGFTLFRIDVPWVQWGIVATGIVSWELAEWFMEQKDLINSAEPLANRWISDPVISLVGAAVGMRWTTA